MANELVKNPNIINPEEIIFVDIISDVGNVFRRVYENGAINIEDSYYQITTNKGIYKINKSAIRSAIVPSKGYQIQSDYLIPGMYILFKEKQH